MAGFFDTKIEFLKGVGPQKALLINKELSVFTFGDLIQHYPFRYEDRTKFHTISELDENMPFVQVKGKINRTETIGPPRKQRLVAYLSDGTGETELVWFKGVQWVKKRLNPGAEYVIFGKPSVFGSKINFAHPEIDLYTPGHEQSGYLQPVYPLTELLRNRYIDNKVFYKLIKTLITQSESKIIETLPTYLIKQRGLVSKSTALVNIHFPENSRALANARFRLKFEEFFFLQLRLLLLKLTRRGKYKGFVFKETKLLTRFYEDHLPFELTEAQKKVVKEIYTDFKSGQQMNRLLQGDVGSGKTIVAFICILIAIDGGYQATLMAPTEILAIQHFDNLKPFAESVGITIALLTGSTKKANRKVIQEQLHDGQLQILVGTHALLEDVVQFKNLGLAIIDEQHRFGVAQRSKLWRKNENIYPHVLVMTATPIPRTLAMTLYGDLDVSVIDELPKGRKPVLTSHRYDSNRLKVNGFMHEKIAEGRQVYIVYPLIEESEKLDLKDLMDGYESVCRAFSGVPVSIVHGKMKADAKKYEMDRFVKGETKIMVATTVIEVGVNVPNATIMIIENAERFGLAQLHQLRGRVGRGSDQSYCILMSGYKLSKEARVRIDTMVKTNNGFEISDMDLKLRGPGDIRGTQQSGIADLLIGDLGKDGEILTAARGEATTLLQRDPDLSSSENERLKRHIEKQKKHTINWSRIS